MDESKKEREKRLRKHELSEGPIIGGSDKIYPALTRAYANIKNALRSIQRILTKSTNRENS